MEKLAFSSKINQRRCGFRERVFHVSIGRKAGLAAGQGAIVQLGCHATSGKLERLIGLICLGSLPVKEGPTESPNLVTEWRVLQNEGMTVQVVKGPAAPAPAVDDLFQPVR